MSLPVQEAESGQLGSSRVASACILEELAARSFPNFSNSHLGHSSKPDAMKSRVWRLDISQVFSLLLHQLICKVLIALKICGFLTVR